MSSVSSDPLAMTMTTGSPRRGGPPRPDSPAAAASTDVSSREEEEEEEAKMWKSLNEALRRKLAVVDVDGADLKPFKCVDDVIAFFDWIYRENREEIDGG